MSFGWINMFMNFGWINWINMAAVVWLVLINIIVAVQGLSDRFGSKYPAVNIFEQIGRYGCMVFMICPIFIRDWNFGFGSVAAVLIWICLTILLLVVYSLLWVIYGLLRMKKASSGGFVLYGLAIIPVLLFLMNGILLRHLALVIASLVFGISHFIIARENV